MLWSKCFPVPLKILTADHMMQVWDSVRALCRPAKLTEACPAERGSRTIAVFFWGYRYYRD